MINVNSLPVEGKRIFVAHEFDKLHLEQEKIYSDWIEKKKCSCVKELKSGKVLRCSHIKSEIEEKIKEKRKRIISLSQEIIIQEQFLRKQETDLEHLVALQVL